MIELAVMTFSLEPGNLDETLDKARGLGLKIVDLTTRMDAALQIDRMLAATQPSEQATIVNQALDARGMRVSEVFWLNFGTAVNHPDATKRARTIELFDGFCQFCHEIGAESTMGIPGPVYKELGIDESYRLSIESLKALVEVAGRHNILFNMEPHWPSLAESPEGVARLCDAVPGMGITLDYSHFQRQGYTQEAVEPLHAYARHYHARQACDGNPNVSRDEGTIDFGRIIRKLKVDQYDGVVCLEYMTRGLDDACQETAWLKDELEWFLAEG